MSRSSGKPEIPVLPNLDLDFQNFFDDNISDVNMADQDFFQMNMDTFDAASELVSNVWISHQSLTDIAQNPCVYNLS